MSQPRRWCFYKIEEPHNKQDFPPQMCLSIEDAFMKFIATKVDNVTISGYMFNFQNMECTLPQGVFKLSSNGGYVPYKVQMGDVVAVPSAELSIISTFDQSKIGHRWFWWANPGGADPFGLYKRNGATNPMWTHYSPADEEQLNILYSKYPNDPEARSINKLFCVRFECTYESQYKVMIQGRNDDENNNNKPDQNKRRRPIIRATFCWCWDNSNGAGDPVWVPYEVEMSTLLEEAFFAGRPEIDVTLDSGNYTINFSQWIQFIATDPSKKRRIKRFGTEYVDLFTRNIGGGYGGSVNDSIPQHWDKGQPERIFVSQVGKPEELNAIGQLIVNSNQGIKLFTIFHNIAITFYFFMVPF